MNLPDSPGKQTFYKYISDLYDRLKAAYQLASDEALCAGKLNKEQYDRRARAGTLNVGSEILVKVLAFDGKHKIADRWEHEPYVVKEQPDATIPVYIVHKEK